jgi:glucan phosphoethanolaminetransferase (alkaline phosphatase superfamily)
VHTDIFLKDIAELVMEQKEPLCAWYMPDHGENLNDLGDKNFAHGCSGFTKYEIELPSVIFFNESFLKGTPEIKTLKGNKDILVSHSNVSHTIMGLCGAYPKEYLDEYDISSDYFRLEDPYLIDVDLFPIRYSKAEIKR